MTIGLLGLFPVGAPSSGQVFAASQWPIAEWEEVIGGSGLPALGALLCFLASLILEQFTQSDPWLEHCQPSNECSLGHPNCSQVLSTSVLGDVDGQCDQEAWTDQSVLLIQQYQNGVGGSEALQPGRHIPEIA